MRTPSRRLPAIVMFGVVGVAGMMLCLPATALAAPPSGEAPPTSPAPSDGVGVTVASPEATPPDAPPSDEAPPASETATPTTPPEEPTADPAAAPPQSGVSTPPDDLMAPSKDDEARRPTTAPPARPGLRPGDTQKPSFATRDGLWDPLYRPRRNPLLPHVAVRAGGMIGSGGSRFNGRGGGLSVDAGIAWNFVGIAAHGTVSAGEWGVGVDSPRVANVIGGGGLTVNMGRLALLGAGVLALSVGYDVLAMPTRRDPRLPPPVAGELVPDNRTHVPHGPRIRLDLGLLALQSRTAKVRHALGAYVGYQVLVGDLGARGALPPINVMSIGISYWMG